MLASEEQKVKFQNRFLNTPLKVRNKTIKVREVKRVPEFMKKPRRDRKERRKPKKKGDLDKQVDVYQRIAPLEKVAYARQLEIKQATVVRQVKEYQEKARRVFKSDPVLIRQKWLKKGSDLREKVEGIVFKCDDSSVKEKLEAALEVRKKEFISKGESDGEMLKKALEEGEGEEGWEKEFNKYDFSEARGVKRNKSEFTFGEDVESGKLRVGYFVSRDEEKKQWKVDRKKGVGNNSELSHGVADLVERLLNAERTNAESTCKGKLQAYNYYTREGCFRYLILRWEVTSESLYARSSSSSNWFVDSKVKPSRSKLFPFSSKKRANSRI